MVSIMLQHQVTPKELGFLHLDSTNHERGNVLIKGRRTTNDCFKGISQQEERSRILHTTLQHQDIPEISESSQFGSMNLERNLLGKCSSLVIEKNNLQIYPMKDCAKEKFKLIKDLIANRDNTI